MTDKQQFSTCNNIFQNAFANLYKIPVPNSVPKLFLNNRMNICLILGNKILFRGWNSYLRSILSASAGIANEFDNVIVNLLLLK